MGGNNYHVIDNDGEACLKNIEVEGDLDSTCSILIGVIKVTSSFYKCKAKGSKNKEKIADVGDRIFYIHSEKSEKLWFKVESKVKARDNVLWWRSRKEIFGHGINTGTTVFDIQAEKRGLYGPKYSQVGCFFVTFGCKKYKRKIEDPVGVWIATSFYSNVMVPHIIQLGHIAKYNKLVQQPKQQQAQQEYEQQLLLPPIEPIMHQAPSVHYQIAYEQQQMPQFYNNIFWYIPNIQ